MMHRLGPLTVGRRFRRVAALTLAMHVAMLALAPLADAVLEARQPRVHHIESESSKSSCSFHEHLTCQLCSVITVVGIPSRCTAALAAPPRLAPHGEFRSGPPTQTAVFRSRPARAPPAS